MRRDRRRVVLLVILLPGPGLLRSPPVGLSGAETWPRPRPESDARVATTSANGAASAASRH